MEADPPTLQVPDDAPVLTIPDEVKNETQDPQPTSKKQKAVHFIFHGACPDGFMTCLLMDLFRFAVHKQGLVFSEILEKIFETDWKENGSNLILDPPDCSTNAELRKWTGALDKVPEGGEEQPSPDIMYFPVVHTSTQNNIDRIKKNSSPKDIAIISDIGNLQVFTQLYPLFSKVYFLDHHLTSFTDGLSDPAFISKYAEKGMFFFSKPFAATQLFYNLLMPSKILQGVYSASFGENLETLALTIAKGDVNSSLALTPTERQIKSGLMGLSDFEHFSKSRIPLYLRKAANYDIDIYVTRGKTCLAEQDKEIQEELKKFQYGAYEYESKEAGKKVLLRFLAINSNTRFKSELGNHLSRLAADKGLDPVGLVYDEIVNKPGLFKGGWRSLNEPGLPDINVCEVAELLDGGGHRNASGSAFDKKFITKMLELGSKLKKEFEQAALEK
jgi:hypothetical protein